MRVADLHWSQIEELLRSEDRAVLPVGSIEQHAFLSLATDAILAERVAVEAAEPLGVPVFPVVPYGLTPDFAAFPGTVTLARGTFDAVLRDVLAGIQSHGFRRVLIVNGHGGNRSAWDPLRSWAKAHGLSLRIHDWWAGPKFLETVRSIDPAASHASWMENFPWTRLKGVAMPKTAKPMIDYAHYKTLDPAGVRAYLGDGSFGGLYQRPDDEVHAIWRAGVEETRELLEDGWDRA
jgi:creatinine amidohydrolase